MDTIDRFMTPSVHTIGTKSPLAQAHRVMNDEGIRHLPVLEGGRLVGMLSQRDLHLIETLKDVDPREVTVEEAMAQDCYTVAPGTPLATVAGEMARHKYGSAVIVQGAQVLGIFTTTDALRALSTVLEPRGERAAPPARKAASRKKRAPRKAIPVTRKPARKAAAKKRTARRARR